MIRELSQILLAMHLSTHNMPEVRMKQIAQVIKDQSEKIDIDPLIVVAIITHESNWYERAISADHNDYGLMQYRCLNYHGNCNWLLDGTNNIKAGTDLIRRDIEYCRKVLHREPTTQEWLSPYQGSGRGFKCLPTHMTKDVEDYALCLAKAVERGDDPTQPCECKKIYLKAGRR